MAWVTSLNTQIFGFRREYQVDNVSKGHIMVVGTGIVTPAYMHTDSVSRNVQESFIHNLYVHFNYSLELSYSLILELGVSSHGKIWTVHLQHQTCRMDSLVLGLHSLA